MLIVGAGPAGLTAAVYLARYRRRVLVVHDEASRAARIPLTRNVPGFPGGVAGPELLQRMRDQAQLYGAEIRRDRIQALRQDRGFQALGDEGTYRARSVILATGIALNEIDLPVAVHEEALRLACLRYCPICDGFEATRKAVAVLGSSTHGAREALFLREYTDRVTLLAREACELSDAQRGELAAAGVQVRDAPVVDVRPAATGMQVILADDTRLSFDVLYPALGCEPRSELAAQLGMGLSDAGCIPTDAGQALALPGLYAAGDVVDALDQISVAIGHGAIAATHAHNWLREQDGRMLQTA
ncbi:NAD(P)/FAD-dependent oxidoreductase [Phenylobacterium sp. LjRoot219]|uniref:NAD(P)/FAD-dependent oxidoreductase n=1 Tax=Phenylobacterium sp. LjRoot219 TaxID=3342283 RepID=UPI003ECDB106